MQKLLHRRRLLLTMLVTAVVIAVAVLIIVMARDAGVTKPTAKSNGGTAAGLFTIDIRDFTYMPATVTVRAGSRVRWVNDDTAPHTATAAGAFDTGGLRKGDAKVLTLDKPGSYSYVCAFHPFMKGTVVVE